MFNIVEQTFNSWRKKYRGKSEEEAKDQPSRRPGHSGFASIEVVPTLVQSRSQLFAEIGDLKLYKEVPAKYLKTLFS